MRDRFKKELDKKVQEYTASIHFDKRLFKQDIAFYICQSR